MSETDESYGSAFSSEADVEHYESLYREGRHDLLLWELERSFLVDTIHGFPRRGELRVLDFACGTGRVTGALDEHVDHLTGIEISPKMASVAARRVPAARLCVGDGLSEDVLPDETFDLITSFRFLLNASADMRVQALRNFARWLEPGRGILVCHNHGNRHSFRHLHLKWTRSAWSNELSHRDMRDLLEGAGFAVVAVRGFGVLPQPLYRKPIKPLLARIERFLARHQLLSRYAVDQIYIAERV